MRSPSLRREAPGAHPLALRRFVFYRGRSQPIGAWLAELGIKPSTYTERRRRGWPLYRAIFTPASERPPIRRAGPTLRDQLAEAHAEIDRLRARVAELERNGGIAGANAGRNEVFP